MARKKSSKTFDKPLISKDFWLKKLIRGKYTLGETFWIAQTIPAFIYGVLFAAINFNQMFESNSISLLLALNIFIYGSLGYFICCMIGTWRAAEKYKQIKKKKKESLLWGFAAQIYVAISAVRTVYAFIFG